MWKKAVSEEGKVHSGMREGKEGTNSILGRVFAD